MAIRMSGINSGLDTDAIVQALVSTYSVKKESYQKKQTKLNWTMDAWKSLNTKVYSLYTNVSKLKYQSAYVMNKTTVSDNTKASVTASNSAVKGTQKLKISQIAQSAYLTGGKMKTKASNSSTLAELGYSQSGGDAAKINLVRGNGETTELSINATDTVDDVLNKLKDAGLNASLDTTNNRIFISAKTTGVASDFDLVATNSNGNSLLSVLGLGTSLGSVDASGNINYTETGETYRKYAVYDKGSEADTKANLDTLAQEYASKKAASEDYSRQISNLTLGISYEKAYNNLNDFYTANAAKITNKDQFNSGMTTADDNLVDENGHVYTKTSEKDANGNDIYAYDDGKGNKSYISSVVAADGTISYKVASKDITGYKTSDGTQATKVNDDEYTVTKDGNTITYKKNADGKFVNTADEKDVLTEQYVYNTGSAATGVLVAKDIKSQFTDEEKSTFTSNYNTVTSFENQAKAETNGKDLLDNSKTAIMNSVHNGVAINYAADINTLSNNKADADEYMEEHSTISGLASKYGTSDYDAALTSMTSMVTAAAQALNNIGSATDSAAVKTAGKNAVIYLNGAEFESESNTISVNGLTIEAKATTGNDEILVTTDTDTQGIYDKIKDFITEYNNIINEMCSLYNADSSKGYEPLTDDEKEAMTDSEIEKWETKIKDSLLRKDTTLGGIMDAMTGAMFKSYEVNGKKYSLASFGISTLGYMNSAKNEYYAYHIDGDEDDANTSGKTDRLMAAIKEDPDTVISFMKQLSSNLHDEIGNKMARTSLSSSYTIYNDKQMSSQYSSYTKTIAEWEKRLSEKEDYYYKKFSAMETALAKLNSTQSSMGGFFG